MPPVAPPVDEVAELKKEIAKLQERNYQNEKKAMLKEIASIDPKVAEKHKGAELSKLEVVLEALKDVHPKFAVDRQDAKPAEEPKGYYYDRMKGQWV